MAKGFAERRKILVGKAVPQLRDQRVRDNALHHQAISRLNFFLIVWSSVSFVNGAEGISDIEGKAATASGERAGKRASFKFVV
jgi:hypothetical protein